MGFLKRAFTISLCALLLWAVFSLPAAALDADGSASGRVIRVGVSGKMAPLLYVDDSGAVLGAFADMMDRIARTGGYAVEYVNYRLAMEALRALQDGELDAVLGTFSEKAGKLPSLEMSQELYSATLCLAESKVPKNDASGYYGAYEMDTIPYQLMTLLNVDSVNVLASQDAVLDYLLYGPSSRVLAFRDCISYRLDNEGLESSYTINASNVNYVSFGIALRTGNPALRNGINEGIIALRSSREYEDILKRWGMRNELEEANVRTARLLRTIGYIAAGAAVLTLISIAVSMRLRSMVRLQTAELSEKIEDLEHASDLRNALIERSSAGSMVLKRDGTILLMNDAMRKLAGVAEGADVRNVSELGLINRVWKLSPPEMGQPELYTERGSDGQTRVYRYQNHRSVNHDERVFIMEDISREEAEKQEAFEEDKNKALNRIIAGIAHEVKNPLTTIRTYASLAETETGNPEFVRAFVEYVPKEVDRISDLIENLVDYSRPVHTDKERFAAGEVARSCLRLAYVYSKKIAISQEIDDSLVLYMGKDQYRQVLINFLINAIQSVEEKIEKGADGPVSIALKIYKSGSEIVTEVSDTGVGMNEEQLKQCTEPFYTTKKKGTGMGLALAKQFIKENDGRLEIESREGLGTSVRMIFTEDTGDE
ncbi:MAG: transporter substrate-binding domain-containing protein [Clostridia bacterium]|nr:transporter substrate-binding domain-containing protein [Clostridia bacterium]